MAFNYILLPCLVALIGFGCAGLSGRRLLRLPSKPFGGARKVIEGIILSVAALITFILAASFALNAAIFASYRASPPGAFHTVDGHTMRIDCTGSGSPALVLEAGAGNGGLVWSGVQPALAKTTRVCSYDRAGTGWSSAVTSPRDADHIADQLHALLRAAHVEGPIILVGHSLGGLYVRDYAARYPEQVAGLVLVDSTIPHQDKMGIPMGSPPPGVLVQALLSSGVNHWGFLAMNPKVPRPAIDEASYPDLQEAYAEAKAFDRSSDEVMRAPTHGDLPILILSHDPAWMAAAGSPEIARIMGTFERLQQDQLRLSARSRRIIAKGAGHYIQFNRPGLLEKSVASFVGQVRGTAPAQYGTTTTE